MTLDSKTKPLYTISHTKQHTIYRTADGKRVPGVTTVLGVINKPALLAWAHKCGLDVQDYRKAAEEAASIGTIAHAMCEAHLRDMKLDTHNLPPEYVNKAETSFIKFLSWWDSEGLEVVETECAIVSEVWRCGGTCDIIAKDPAGRFWLIDLKTSKGIYDEMLVQTSAYADFYEECRMVPIHKVLIVRIGKDDAGDFDTREVHNRPEQLAVFEHALGLYRARQKAKHR